MCRTVTGTANLGLLFDGNSGKCVVQGYADADCGGDFNIARRSTTGCIFQVYGVQLPGSLDCKPLLFCQLLKPDTWLLSMQLNKQLGFDFCLMTFN
jgi:hypothetical protein